MASERITAGVARRWAAAQETARLHDLPSYGHFLRHLLHTSCPYATYTRFRSLFSPTLWLWRLFRWANRLLLLVGTSALLILAAAVLLLLLPLACLLSLAFWCATQYEQRRTDRSLETVLAGRHVVVLFADQATAALFPPFYTVLVVSHRLPCRSPFRVAARERSGCIRIREHYFFHLRRTILPQATRVALLF